jgi:hypothetical protein
MQLDNIFEDLEAQFDFALESSATKSSFETSNLARVRRHDGRTAELVHPVLGEDFIAGMVLGANAFRLYRLVTLSQLEFKTLVGLDLPAVQCTTLSTRGFLANISLPSAIAWSTLEAVEVKRGVWLDLVGELLLINMLKIDDPIGVPLTSLSDLQIDSVDNRNADS